MEICKFKVHIQKDRLFLPNMDKMAEWLRRWTVNPLGSASMGSNPIFVVFLFGSLVNYIAICNLNPDIRVQISEKKLESWKPPPPPPLKFRKKKTKYLKKELPAVRCFRWLVSLLHINSSIADDNVENNDQVILPRLEMGTFWLISTHDNDYNEKS